MRFVSIWRPKGSIDQQPTEKLMQEMGAFMAEAVQKGVLVATEGFGSSTKNDLLARLEGDRFTVTDGPFTEAKELIGGFAILQVKSREELVEWTRRFMVICGDGECEIHRLPDVSPVDQVRQV